MSTVLDDYSRFIVTRRLFATLNAKVFLTLNDTLRLTGPDQAK
ncbi:MAG: hypothetical protein ACI8P9_002408 [Parasphingorhabdus sp.]|jgi:hypothetical protein